MTYDPRQCGALCDVCPLRGRRVVPPESNKDAQYVVIGEAPGEQEEKLGRPFVGPPGAEMDAALRKAGSHRGKAHLTTAILCRPPNNDLPRLMQKLKIAAKQAASKVIENDDEKEPEDDGADELELTFIGTDTGTRVMSPMECCAPRLQREVAKYKDFIAVGKTAVEAISGTHNSILSIRGAVMELAATERTPHRRIMPTVSPSFVLKQQRWRHVFLSDVAKAMRYFRGVATWKPPEIVYNPSPSALRDFLREKRLFAYDIETDGIESLDANIRCIAIGDAAKVMVIGMRSNQRPKVDGEHQLYWDFYDEPNEIDAIFALMKEFFENEKIPKVSHNGGYYDRIVMRKRLNIDVKPNVDTILLHRSVESELPHSLAYVASLYTDAPAWKCYDGETEVMTPTGWVRFDALANDVPVMQWDNGVLTYAVPSAYVRQYYAGPMYRLQNQALSLLVTPDHKMIYRPIKALNCKEYLVQDMPKTGHVPHTGVYSAGQEENVDFVKLLVAFQADGAWAWRNREEDKIPAYLDFSLTKQRKIERLCRILDNLSIAYQKTQTGNVNPRTRIWITDEAVVLRLWTLLGLNKLYQSWLFTWNINTRRLFLSELCLWDGHQSKTHAQYDTAIQHNADYVSACAAISGRVARLSQIDTGMWRVRFCVGTKRDRTWSKVSEINTLITFFEGMTYCVSVPSGFLLVRREGKIVVCGNTDREGNKLALGKESDQELHEYCAKDVAIDAALVGPLLNEVKQRQQLDVYKLDMKIQEICMVMHMTGMYVDQAARHKREVQLLKDRHMLLTEIRKGVGRSDFNPASTHHMRNLLFDRWGLDLTGVDEKDRMTDSGDLSTGDLILRYLLMNPRVSEEHRALIKLLRRYRKTLKVLGTYVVKMRPSNMNANVGWDDDEDWADVETRKRYGEIKKGIVNPRTGRMYPGYNAQVAVCVDPETWLLTKEGPRQIGTLSGFGSPQTEQEVSNLLLHDGKQFSSVSHLQNPGICPTRGIQTELGTLLIATPHHRIRVGETQEWKRMDEISTDDWIALPKGMNVWGDTLPGWASPSIAYFCGLYTAYGMRQGNTIRWTGLEKQARLSLITLCGQLFKTATASETASDVVLTGVSIDKLLSIFGLAEGKGKTGIPTWIQAAPKNIVLEFLKGLHFTAARIQRSTHSSYWRYKGPAGLVTAIQMWLLNLGVVATVTTAAISAELWVMGAQAQRLAQVLGLVWPTEYPAVAHTSERRWIDHTDFVFVRVAKTWDAGERQVYDVTIPTTHQFWANGTISHNTGRLSSSKPINAQNYPKGLRSLVIAQPGHVLVGADMDQLELRIAAARWQVELYLRAFEEGKDPHSMTAFAVFGSAFIAAAGLPANAFDLRGKLQGEAYDENGKFIGSGQSKTYRDLSKAVQYASQYMATVETVHKIIKKTEVPVKDKETGKPKEDGSTELPYALMPLKQVDEMRGNWLKGAPEFEKGWEREIGHYRVHGNITEPITGRRRDFLDGEAPNEIVNFPIQSSAAGLMNKALVRLYEELPFEKWGPGTGLINQCHDSIVVECPESEGPRVARLLEECMNQTHPALPGVTFSASATIGKTWKEVG